jgi:CHAD domain-containing protein
MVYRLEKGRKLNRSLKKAVDDQLSGAIRQLLTAGPGNPDGIHQVRKHLKKTRAILRLLRAALEERYQSQNCALRDAARLLSTRRDDEILLEIFDRLTAPLSPEEQERLALVRARLSERKAVAIRIGAIDRMYVLIMLLRLNAVVRRWPAIRCGTVSKGWKKGFKRARRGWRKVEQSGDPVRVHEWRKRVKIHWYHTRLLQSFAPETLSRRRERLRELSVLLGDFHDLTVLREQMAFRPADFGKPDQVARLDQLAETEQVRLLGKARSLGRELFAQKPEWLAEHI